MSYLDRIISSIRNAFGSKAAIDDAEREAVLEAHFQEAKQRREADEGCGLDAFEDSVIAGHDPNQAQDVDDDYPPTAEEIAEQRAELDQADAADALEKIQAAAAYGGLSEAPDDADWAALDRVGISQERAAELIAARQGGGVTEYTTPTYTPAEYRLASYTLAEYSAPTYTPAGPPATPAQPEPAAELPREQRAEVGPSADDYDRLAGSYRAWAKEAHESDMDDRAREFNGYAHFYGERATKLRDEAEVDAAIEAADAEANAERDEAGSITDVIVEEQMTCAGRSAYWQAISEGATPDQAYNDAEAVEYQERRAAEAAGAETEQARQEVTELAWRYDMGDTSRAVVGRG